MPGIIPKATQAICEEVMHERMLQDNKWGEQNHDPFKWLAILGEEVGEVNKAALESFPWKSATAASWGKMDGYRQELIQVAAVAVAMVECLDRGKWIKKKKEASK